MIEKKEHKTRRRKELWKGSRMNPDKEENNFLALAVEVNATFFVVLPREENLKRYPSLNCVIRIGDSY